MFTDRPARHAVHQAGVTLVELIMYIVVISVGITGILLAMTYTAQHSADPMVRQQAQLIAESYLEEILLKRFVDPVSDTVCPSPDAGGRAAYDNVCDYNGLVDSGARDQLNNPVTGLGSYTVTVTVTPNATDTTGSVALGSLSNDYGNGYIRVLRVSVTVAGPGDVSVTLTGYRTNHTCNSTIATAQCRPLT